MVLPNRLFWKVRTLLLLPVYVALLFLLAHFHMGGDRHFTGENRIKNIFKCTLI